MDDSAVYESEQEPPVWSDYEWLPGCQYPVTDNSPDHEGDCEGSAVARWYWVNNDTGKEEGSMRLCEEHFRLVREQEGSLI